MEDPLSNWDEVLDAVLERRMEEIRSGMAVGVHSEEVFIELTGVRTNAGLQVHSTPTSNPSPSRGTSWSFNCSCADEAARSHTWWDKPAGRHPKAPLCGAAVWLAASPERDQ